ncbi:hypothetical protein TNCV_1455231 [Trichonephila clavipes]|nr:hypothetical protein TNCV_1455231 [Trichonephila clavipes]
MEKQSSLDSCSGRRLMTTSADSWSDRTMPSSDLGTATAGAGATSPSRLCFDDAFIVENSDLFFPRETIIARNVYAAWARKLTTAKPNDPDLQKIHVEVSKSGEIVSTHLAKLDSTPPSSPTPSSAPDIDGAPLEEPGEEEMETSNDLPQSQEENFNTLMQFSAKVKPKQSSPTVPKIGGEVSLRETSTPTTFPRIKSGKRCLS